MAPQDLHYVLGAKIQLVDDVMGTLQIQRGRHQSDFDASDIALLQQLVPAISRAAYFGHRIGTLKLEAQTATIAVGAQRIASVVVSADGSIIHLNEDADAFLAQPTCGLVRRNNRLSAHDVATSVALQRLIVDACGAHDGGAPGRGGDLMVLSAGDGAAVPLAVSVGPIAGSPMFGVAPGHHAVVFLRSVTLDVQAGLRGSRAAIVRPHASRSPDRCGASEWHGTERRCGPQGHSVQYCAFLC